MAHPPSRSRRAFLHVSSVAVAGVTLAACAATTTSAPQPTIGAEAPVTNSDQALQRLMEGNQRYVTNKTLPVNESESRRMDVAKGQQPFATIFSCVDSRVPPELVFDRGLGDLFVIRTAGHVLDKAVLGSLEFGVAELHIPPSRRPSKPWRKTLMRKLTSIGWSKAFVPRLSRPKRTPAICSTMLSRQTSH